MPAHHNLVTYLDAYIEAAKIRDGFRRHNRNAYPTVCMNSSTSAGDRVAAAGISQARWPS
jgi:hypothetical protein